MTSEYMAPYIHVGGCTVTHLSVVYVSKTPVLNHCSRTKGYWYKTKNHSGPALDSRDSLTTRRGILRPFPGIFTECGHFHSFNFTHPGAGWQSFPPQTHLYIQNIQTRKSTLDKICSAASLGVISWTIQAQIHQRTFTPTFLYLLDLCWVSVGFGACFFCCSIHSETGCSLGKLPFFSRGSTHEQTMLFMSMGNLEFAVYLNCKLLNCVSGPHEVHMDSLPEPLYCEITVLSHWPWYWPRPPLKFDTARFIVSHQNAKWARAGNHSTTVWLFQHKSQPCVIMKL